MQSYTATVELSTRSVDDDQLVDDLLAFHAVVARSDRGRVEVILTATGETLRQAVATMLAVVEIAAGHSAVGINVMSTDDFDYRNGLMPMPALIGAAEAAEILGVSRQRIVQMVAEGKVGGQVVGNSTVISRDEVKKLAKRMKG